MEISIKDTKLQLAVGATILAASATAGIIHQRRKAKKNNAQQPVKPKKLYLVATSQK